MLKLYSFCWSGFRGGRIESVFIADETEVERLIGREVRFGEILGKHSEVTGTIEANEIEMRSENPELIEWLLSIFGPTICGYNPIYYSGIDDEEYCEEGEEQ
jgi:hypothetical protein